MGVADFRAARIPWAISQDDDTSLTIGWTTDGVALSDGGTGMDVGVAGDWTCRVWSSLDDASNGVAAVATAVVSIPQAHTTQFTIDDATVATLAPMRGWWAATQGNRRTWVCGDFIIAEGVSQ